jgi:hypothetical protein
MSELSTGPPSTSKTEAKKAAKQADQDMRESNT